MLKTQSARKNFIERASFHSKPLSSKPKSELSHTRSNFQTISLNKTGSSFNPSSHKALNFPLDQKTQLRKPFIKLNMTNHFLILDNLFQSGNLTENKGFHFSKELVRKPSEKTKEKCDVLEIMDHCNLAVLNKYEKKKEELKNNSKNQDPKKNINEIKKNFFYFKKQKIKKRSDHTFVKKNRMISQIYQKYFDRKKINKLCNLKEFSEFLLPKNLKNERKNEFEGYDEEKVDLIVSEKKKELEKKLPKLKFDKLNVKRMSFL